MVRDDQGDSAGSFHHYTDCTPSGKAVLSHKRRRKEWPDQHQNEAGRVCKDVDVVDGSNIFSCGLLSRIGVAQLSEGLTVLTDSRDSEVAMEQGGSGVFTQLVVAALQGGAADLRGHITPGSIYAYVDQALGAWDQRPIFKTNVTRFTSLRVVPPQVPLETLRKLVVYFPSTQNEHMRLTRATSTQRQDTTQRM